jgi:hypothetical protein
MKNEYLNLLDNMENLTDSEKRTLLSITTYLNKEELEEFANFNKEQNISVRDSLKLENTDINNEKIKEVISRFKKYVKS